jgi:hypothetical protein
MSEEKKKSKTKVLLKQFAAGVKFVLFHEKNARTRQLFVYSLLMYAFVPVLCGFLTAGILHLGILQKLGLDKFDFAKFPTIRFQGSLLSTYSGLILIAGLGCILGLFFSRILKLAAKLGHFNYICPPTSPDSMPNPSVANLVRAVLRIASIPVIVVLGTISSLHLAKTGILPGVLVDREYQSFEVNMPGIVIVASLGCLMMFIYNILTMILLKITRKKDVEVETGEFR